MPIQYQSWEEQLGIKPLTQDATYGSDRVQIWDNSIISGLNQQPFMKIKVSFEGNLHDMIFC